VFSAWSVSRLYNESVFVALSSTESREPREWGCNRVESELENWVEFW
jgi:hypothetical protein